MKHSMIFKDNSFKGASLLILGLMLSLTLTQKVLASDLAVLRGTDDDYMSDPPPRMYSKWSGFYIGGQVSFLQGTLKFGDTLQNTLAPVVQGSAIGDAIIKSATLTLPQRTAHSMGYGGFVGYNWNFNGTLFGFELDYSSANLKTRTTNSEVQQATIIPEVTPPKNGSLGVQIAATSAVKVKNLGSFRLRGGFSMGNLLPYALLGVAVGQGSNKNLVTATNNIWITPPDIILPSGVTIPQPPYWAPAPQSINPWPPTTQYLDNQVHSVYWWGYTVGVGTEINFTNNIFGRLEYTFTALDSGSKSGQPQFNRVTGGIGFRF